MQEKAQRINAGISQVGVILTLFRRIGPAYEKIGEEYADSLAVGKINIDEETRLAWAEGIEDIPTLVLYRNGKAVDSIIAPGSKAEIDRFIQEALAK